MVSLGSPVAEPSASMARTTSMPFVTRPNTTCLRFNLSHKKHNRGGEPQSAEVPVCEGAAWHSQECSTHHIGHNQSASQQAAAFLVPWSCVERDKELRVVAARARVGHGEQASSVMATAPMLVSKGRPVNAHTTCAISMGNVSSLHTTHAQTQSERDTAACAIVST